ncbi:MAG: site-specific integrase [Anaerolineae bacterium]|nr:site-specific integrase [Anaerolineae bacterium]
MDLLPTYELDQSLTIGQVADQFAARQSFSDYRSRKAKNTITRQDDDLALFTDFLIEVGAAPTGNLSTEPDAWTGVTWGLIEGFIRWQLQRGFAVSSINVRLSTVKAYAKLALKACTLEPTQYALIRAVNGYSHREGKRIDEARIMVELPTRYKRLGAKKTEAVNLSRETAVVLKNQPDTPQGRRDALLMCLLLDHGLRCGEVARLQVTDLDLKMNELVFYRPKVDLVQRHQLTTDTLRAAKAYFEQDILAQGPLLRGSRKSNLLRETGMTERAITKRVAVLGKAVGVKGLSAHDCRHYWATTAARNGTQIDRLQQAGGWSSPAMPLRYIKIAEIANEGVNLGND